jgi:hypothetical protein
VLSDGNITGARIYSSSQESGDHIIRLWVYNGTSYSLLSGPYTWNIAEGTEGWREYKFTTPIPVQANARYIVSITTGSDANRYYAQDIDFTSLTSNNYLRYLGGLYTTSLTGVPDLQYNSSCYFRDIIFTSVAGGLTSGTIGTSQGICYGVVPASLTELSSPTGGTGEYSYQWQSSLNSTTWTDIAGATGPGYSPGALTQSTYYRRVVSSGSYTPAISNTVQITVSPVISLAQLHDNITIAANTSANIAVTVTGGTGPYTIHYTRNGVSQSPVTDYTGGSAISTGVLASGTYVYTLTSVTDASGCSAQSLGTSITVTVNENQNLPLNSNKVVVLVNSSSSYFAHFDRYVKPYLDNFGVPYDVVDVNISQLPVFQDYGLILLGHRNVYSTGYPIAQISSAIFNGTGLYSFDPHIFDFSSDFNTLKSQTSVTSSLINVTNYTHYISKYHAPDIYNATNNSVNLESSITVVQNSNLAGGTNLASLSSGGQSVPLLQVSAYGNGRIVRWNAYDWISENILGPVSGMDDLVWRGIVWAARKPFVLQGLPPFVTMRVDDVQGSGSGVIDNFRWIQISNEFGFIPWCGTFNNSIPSGYISTLRTLLNNQLATASPHAFSYVDFIFFNHNNLSVFDPASNARSAGLFYTQNGLKMSKFLLPHYYEMSSSALSEIRAYGVEYIGLMMLPDQFYYGSQWINCGPYRLMSSGSTTYPKPFSYAGNITINGFTFFNCFTEIRDDGGYEWYPDYGTVFEKEARGIRHLRRAFNSMVLSTLFTHESRFGDIDASTFREVLSVITSAISEYQPEYKSMDYALQYIRAKSNIRIVDVLETSSNVEIILDGNNDIETRCYLFTEQNGQISSTFVGIPKVNGSVTVSITK